MTDQEKDKLIVEALGECWHQTEPVACYSKCIKCGKGAINLNLATPEGFFWVLERAQKMEWWDKFRLHRGLTLNQQFFLTSLINPTRFRDALAEFLERR